MRKKPKKPKKPGYRLANSVGIIQRLAILSTIGLGGCAGTGAWLNEPVGPDSRPRHEVIAQTTAATAEAVKPALNPKQQGYVDLATPLVGLVLAGLAGVLGSKKEQA